MEGMQESDRRSLTLLGERLKRLREAQRESVAEVSGAVEIDADLLERIERGEEAPSEDILGLLISHFSLREQEAVQLWEWAGFDRTHDAPSEVLSDLASRATLILVALDARVMYSDQAVVNGDQSGLVMNFLQTGPQGQPLPVARIGMSYDQAHRVLNALQQTLLRQKYLPQHRLLPPGETEKR